MLAETAITTLALLLASGPQNPTSVVEAGKRVMFEVCIPLMADQPINATALLESWGAERVQGEVPDTEQWVFPTSDVGTLDIIIPEDRSFCAVHYVGSYLGVAEIAVELVKGGWEGQPTSWGQAWRKGHTFAVTAWAQEESGSHEGLVQILHSNSDGANQMATWFHP